MQETIKINADQAITQLEKVIHKAREANTQIEKLNINLGVLKKEQSDNDYSPNEITNQEIEHLARSYFKEITTTPIYSAEDIKGVAELYKAIIKC